MQGKARKQPFWSCNFHVQVMHSINHLLRVGSQCFCCNLCFLSSSPCQEWLSCWSQNNPPVARTLCGKEVILQHALHARAAWGYALGAPTAGPWSCWEQPRPAEVTGPVPKPEACSILSFLRCCGWVGSSMQQVCRFLGCLLDLCVRRMSQYYIPVHWTSLRRCLYECQIKCLNATSP